MRRAVTEPVCERSQQPAYFVDGPDALRRLRARADAARLDTPARPQVGRVEGLPFVPGRNGAGEVPPENPSSRLEHAVHLGSDIGTEVARRDAAETDELRHQVEVSRRKRQRQAAAVAKADFGVHGAGRREAAVRQIDANNVRGPGPQFQHPAQPAAVPAADVEDFQPGKVLPPGRPLDEFYKGDLCLGPQPDVARREAIPVGPERRFRLVPPRVGRDGFHPGAFIFNSRVGQALRSAGTRVQ